MKKLILYITLICSISVGLVSCEDEIGDESTITYYATLTLYGESVVFWDLNETYVDPGYYAEMNGEDVTSEVEIEGTVDITTPGVYTLTYSVTNADGYSTSEERTVMVSDPTESPIESGYWSVTLSSYRNYDGTIKNYSSTYSVAILQTAPGVFYITDLFAGWYDQSAGYGSDYAMTGTFQLNDDNSITALSSYLSGWGDSIDELANGKYDSSTGEIYYEVSYVNYKMTFYITLTKN